MSRHCQVTGRAPTFGNHVSHSQRRTKRRFDPNVQQRRYDVPSLGRTVHLTVSTKGMRIIDKRGIDAVVNDLRARGVRL